MANSFTRFNPPGFFLWEFVKDTVYSSPVPDLETLKRRITNAVMSVTEEMLTRACGEIQSPVVDNKATRGAHKKCTTIVYSCKKLEKLLVLSVSKTLF
jgi:hypothetical protein